MSNALEYTDYTLTKNISKPSVHLEGGKNLFATYLTSSTIRDIFDIVDEIGHQSSFFQLIRLRLRVRAECGSQTRQNNNRKTFHDRLRHVSTIRMLGREIAAAWVCNAFTILASPFHLVCGWERGILY